MTDVDNMWAFVKHHHPTLRYAVGVGWMAWGGQKWEKCGEPVLQALQTIEAAAATEPESPAWVHEIANAIKTKRSSEPSLRRMIGLAKDLPEMRVTADVFDYQPHWLNCQDGVLNLETGRLGPHEPTSWATKMTGVPYNPPEGAPKKPEQWLAHLDTITDGNAALKAYLQRAFGYTLGGSVEEQVVFVAHGTGSNGKSVTLNVVAKILGDYAQTADRNLLVRSSQNAIGHNLVQLKGARLCVANETGAGNDLDEVSVKQLASSDPVTARLLYHNNMTFTPTAKVWLATNHRPNIHSSDRGIWRRIREVPFNAVIDDEFKVKNFDDVLFYSEGSAILQWMVKGYQLWRKHGLAPPEIVADAIEEYRDHQEPSRIGEFLHDHCRLSSSYKESNRVVWEAYTAWYEGLAKLDDAPAVRLGKHALFDKLCEHGMRRGKWAGGNVRGLVGMAIGKTM